MLYYQFRNEACDSACKLIKKITKYFLFPSKILFPPQNCYPLQGATFGTFLQWAALCAEVLYNNFFRMSAKELDYILTKVYVTPLLEKKIHFLQNL